MGYLYLFSICFYVYILIKKQISIGNIFPYIFLGFAVLYPGSCYINHISDSGFGFDISLTSDSKIINYYLFSSFSAITTFALCIFFDKKSFIKNNTLLLIPDNNMAIKANIIYCIAFPITVYLSAISNWTTGARIGFIPSMSAYFRNIITVLTIVLFRYGDQENKIKKLILLVLFGIITFLSTQRTNFLIVGMAYIYTIKDSKSALKYAFLFIILLLVAGSLRNGISATEFLYPIFGEGIFGSWGTLNAIYEIQSYGYEVNNMIYAFNGIFNFFLKFFSLNLPTVSSILWSHGIVYYPMGGFFYLSDAILWNPILGPPIYSFAYRLWIIQKSPYALLYLGLSFELVKADSTVITAMYIFHLLVMYFVLKIGKLKIKL